MAFDAFLKIADIPGESTDDKHKDWVEILSYSLSVDQPQSAAASFGGGATSERAEFSNFSVVKALDKTSPKLFLYCANGTHIDDVTIELCRAGGDKLKYMEYKMTNCIITSVRPGGSSGGAETLPLEEVSIDYGKMEITYTQQKRKGGGGGGNIKAFWNLETNTGG